MGTDRKSTKFNRRDFLKISGIAGAAAAGGHLLDTYRPWLDYEEQIGQNSITLKRSPNMSAEMMEMIRYATLAANGHNTQPWKFAIKGDSIEIYPDYSRHLQVVDPDDREMWISLGCALENILVTARAIGYHAEVTYPDGEELIRVQLSSDAAQEEVLFHAIPLRQTTRSEYDGKAVKNAELEQLLALELEPGVELTFLTSQTELEAAVEYVHQGNLTQYADHAFVDELITWLRFNKKEALASLDGLYSVCSGNPAVPGWLGRMFVAGMKPEQQAELDTQKIRSSAGAVVIASAGEDPSAWVRSGQVYQRMSLTMTSLGIKSAFMNQPIEIADLRGQFQQALNLGSSLPQLLVRFGYADAMPRSMRRPVAQVLVSAE